MPNKQIKEIIARTMPSTRIPDRADHQMNLGSLIKALSRERDGLLVMTSNGDSPGMPHMYYGYASDVAFNVSNAPITVAEFLDVCDDAMGKPFMGTQGEDLVIKPNMPVWISDVGVETSNAIVDLVPTNGFIKLIIKHME